MNRNTYWFEELLQKSLRSNKLLIFIAVFCLLPFLTLSFFNHPSADDFCYFSTSRDMGFWEAQIDWYQEWSGRYFSTAILSLEIFRDKAFYVYKFAPIALITGLFLVVWQIENFLFGRAKKKRKYYLTLFFLSVYLIQMPSIVQGVYWLAGSVTYQLSNILGIALCYSLIRLLHTKNKMDLVFAIVCVIFVMGTNETTMLMLDFLLGAIFVINLITKRKVNYQILVLVFIAIVCSLIVVKSPGNDVRGALYPNQHNVIYAVLRSLTSIALYTANWLPVTACFFLVYFDVFKRQKNSVRTSVFDVPLFWAFGVFFGVLFIGFFTGYWSMGKGIPSRTVNTVYFYFITGLVYLFFVVYFKLEKSYQDRFVFSKVQRYFCLVLAISFLFQDSNVLDAYKDLITGSAYRYDIAIKNRYTRINLHTNAKGYYLPKLEDKPKTLFFGDITDDSKHWKNECYDTFWRTNGVKIKE